MLEFLNQAWEFLSANASSISMGLGIVWMVVCKIFSTEKASGVVAIMQKGLDFVAKLCEGIGKVCAGISGFLAALIKSDGIAGKK